MAAKEITVGNLRAWVHEANGTPLARVTLVHGLGEHSGRHAGTAQRLSAGGYEVVRFDQRGCGQSGGKRQWIERFDDYVDDVRAVMRWADAARTPLKTFLLGHSLGGAIAIKTAASGQKIDGLMLLAPAYIPGAGVSPLKIAIGKLIERLAPKLKIPGSLDVTAISRDAKEVAAYKQDPLNCSFNTVRQGNEILRALPTLPAACRAIKLPVLVAHGDADRLIKVEGSRELFAALASPDKTLKEFPGAYHELHNDLDREALFKTLLEWLRRRV